MKGENIMPKKIDSKLFSAILYIIVGVLLAVFRSEWVGLAMTIVGIVFIVSGVLELLKKNWTGGAISLVIGLAILILGWTAAQIVFLVLGILLAIKGVLALLDVLKKSNKGILDFIFPVLTIVIGILLAFAFGKVLDVILVIGGIFLAINGVLGLIAALKK